MINKFLLHIFFKWLFYKKLDYLFMGFTGNELIKAADFLHIESSTGLFILFLFLSALLAFFTLTFTYLFIDTPLTSKIIAKR